MNLDELRSVQSKERSKDSLQHLRESFYADVADYVADLRERRDQLAERADNPFDDPEVNRLTDEIKTAEEVVEAVYERRVGKVVKRASLAAAGMPADEEGLTSEEQKLFTELVERIESNKQEVLDVLAGDETASTGVATGTTDAATGTTDAAAESAPTPGEGSAPGDGPALGDASPSDASDAPASEDAPAGGDVNAADVMGGTATDSTDASGANTTDASAGTAATEADDDARPGSEAAAVAGAGGSAGEDARALDGESATDEGDSQDDETDPRAGLDERTTVRVTSDVGEIFGVDERTYDLASEDVVTLPEANAEPLVERGAAEKLD